MSQESDTKLVREHLDNLGEHFDSVQIFCTRHESGESDGTRHIQMGIGNWFARYGHVVNWLAGQEEHGRITVRDEREEDKQ